MFILPQFQFFKWKAITSAAAAQVVTYDAYFNYTSLLINAESVSTGSQNSTFIDSSTNNFTITPNGNPTQTSLTPYAPNDWSVYFNGSTDSIFTSNLTAAYPVASGANFTLEGWVYPMNQNGLIFLYGASKVAFGTDTGITVSTSNATVVIAGVSNTINFPTSMVLNQWQHWAIVRSSGIIRAYLNGIPGNGVSASGAISPYLQRSDLSGPLGIYMGIGTANWTGYTPTYFNGYISNVRYVINQALYTGIFTPSPLPVTTTSVGASGNNVVTSLTGTVSLLTCKGNRFIDTSSNNKTFTPTGTPRVVKDNPYSAYSNVGNSVYINGTSSLVVTRNTAFLTPANTDFTIEAWVRPTANPANAVQGAQIIGLHEFGTNGDWIFNLGGTTFSPGMSTLTPVFYMVAGAQMTLSATNTQLSLNTWNHIAVTRSGTGSNNIKLFVNGVVTNSASNNNSLQGTGSNNLCIGSDSANDESRYTGFVSNVRMVSGQALYIGNFTPNTTPLTNNTVGTSGANVAASLTGTVVLLACQDPVVTTENSSSTKTITTSGTPFATTNTPFLSTNGYAPVAYSPSTHGGSVYFDGSTGYLTIPSSSNLALSTTGDFTFETYLYAISGTDKGIFAINSASTGINISIGATGKYRAYIGFTSQSNIVDSTASVSYNQWIHLAIVRQSGTLKFYVNGVSSGSFAYNFNCGDSSSTASVGSCFNNQRFFPGYISDLRLVRGTALYTNDFTPPAAPLSAVANTSLLLKANNGAVFDATNKNLITLNGATSASTTVAKFGSESLFFNGTNSFTSTPETDAITLASGTPFTIEGWLYPTTNTYTSYRVVLYKRTAVAAAVNYGIFLNTTTGGISFHTGSTNIITTSPLTLSAWNHVAVTYDGANLSIYKDGIRISGPTAVSVTNTAGSPLYLGYDVNTGSNYFQGYMDDIRITKGINRYAGLSSFTIPTSAFPTQ